MLHVTPFFTSASFLSYIPAGTVMIAVVAAFGLALATVLSEPRGTQVPVFSFRLRRRDR